MVKVLLDEGVLPTIRHQLDAAGHETTHARYLGLTGDSPEFLGLDTKAKDKLLIEKGRELIGGDFVLITKDLGMKKDLESINFKAPINVIGLDYETQPQSNERTRSMVPGIIAELGKIDRSPDRMANPEFVLVTPGPEKETLAASSDRTAIPDTEKNDDPPEPPSGGAAAKQPEPAGPVGNLSHVDLPKYAAAEHGYEVERRGGDKCLLKKDGEQIRAWRESDGSWSYQNQANKKEDAGDIVSFATRRGADGAALKDYLGRNPDEQTKANKSLEAAQNMQQNTLNRAPGGRDE